MPPLESALTPGSEDGRQTAAQRFAAGTPRRDEFELHDRSCDHRKRSPRAGWDQTACPLTASIIHVQATVQRHVQEFVLAQPAAASKPATATATSFCSWSLLTDKIGKVLSLCACHRTFSNSRSKPILPNGVARRRFSGNADSRLPACCVQQQKRTGEWPSERSVSTAVPAFEGYQVCKQMIN